MTVNGFPQTFRNVTGFSFDPNGGPNTLELCAQVQVGTRQWTRFCCFRLCCPGVTPTADRPRVLGGRPRCRNYRWSRRTRAARPSPRTHTTAVTDQRARRTGDVQSQVKASGQRQRRSRPATADAAACRDTFPPRDLACSCRSTSPAVASVETKARVRAHRAVASVSFWVVTVGTEEGN